MEHGQTLPVQVGRWAFGFILGWSIVITPASASALDLRFPGSFGGESRYPNSPAPEERENYAIEGSLEQGVDWGSTRSRLTLNTFGEVRYSVDTAGLDYNNRLIPGIGVKLKKDFGAGVIQFGVKGVNEYRFESHRSNRIVLGFVNWWFGWNLGGS